jgi:hypothetical protein
MRAVAFQTRPSTRRIRSRVPQLLLRDLQAVGLLVADRPSARTRLDRAVGAETASILRQVATPVL